MDSRTMFGVLGSVTAFITFLSPARELYRIWQQRRSTEQQNYSAVPYHAAVVNCALWVMYGDLHRDIFLAIINNIGIVTAMAYLILFVLLAPAFVDAMKHGIIFLIELSSLFVLARLAITSQDPATFSGIACATGSTFCVVKMVYGTRRMDRASFLESLASFVNGLTWIIYGIILSDKFILLPNLIWAIVGMAHLVQYAVQYHRSSPPQIAEEITSLC